MVIHHPDKNQGPILVVLGSSDDTPSTNENDSTSTDESDSTSTKSAVLLLHLDHDTMAWREAPSMNSNRHFFAAVVCHGALYAIGGEPPDFPIVFDTIERIDVGDLLCPSWSENEIKKWKTLECRLSSGKYACAAAVVQDRFIVVAGGKCHSRDLSSVDIVDTSSESQCIVISGPPLNVDRCYFGMAVVGQRVYAVGGWGGIYLDSVEYLEFEDWRKAGSRNPTISALPFTNKSWKIHQDLVLGTGINMHGVVRMGSCLIAV